MRKTVNLGKARQSPHPSSEWFDTPQAARLAGLTKAMLNYLCRTGLVEPSCDCSRGHGRARHYSFGDVVALRLVARLAAAGISPLRLRKGLEYLRTYHSDITLTSLPASHLVTDGEFLYLKEGHDPLERALDGQYAFAFVVELEQIRREVVERLPDPLTKLTA
ncbi:MerR family transcriptional regulator [Hydrogenophaga sp.]|uniref:MerR family transcriptional regulator n=1 Tax=Hydrogenophaga sp. TaxID=1904254 RepID=UPI003AF6D271